MKKKTIALIGPNESQCSTEIKIFGEALGRSLADEDYNLVTGGLGGFMEAVCKGAKASKNSVNISTIGILPGDDGSLANPWCDIVVPSGIGISRNLLVVRSGDAVVAVGGGAGTLSEIALAWQMGKKIICVDGYGGWSEFLTGTALDSRRSDKLVRLKTTEEVVWALSQWLKQ